MYTCCATACLRFLAAALKTFCTAAACRLLGNGLLRADWNGGGDISVMFANALSLDGASSWHPASAAAATPAAARAVSPLQCAATTLRA